MAVGTMSFVRQTSNSHKTKELDKGGRIRLQHPKAVGFRRIGYLKNTPLNLKTAFAFNLVYFLTLILKGRPQVGLAHPPRGQQYRHLIVSPPGGQIEVPPS